MASSGLSYKTLLKGFFLGGFGLLVACTDSGHAEHEHESSVPMEEPSVPDDSDPPCVDSFEVTDTVPALLSQAGLYSDISQKTIHSSVRSFKPRFQLWSDGADKNRWVYLPECNPIIDTTDMNDWSLPVGTRLFKEFSLNGVLLETRLIERFGPGPRDFRYATYAWNAQEQEATLAPPEGIKGVKGTPHDIPSEPACRQCHGNYAYGGGRPSRALGFGAMQLDHDDTDFSLSKAADEGLLSTRPPQIAMPGDDAAQAALGYLHVNCGVCHNDSVDGLPQANMNLWWDIEHTSLEDTGAFRTAVGQSTQIFKDQNVQGRVVAGDPMGSAIYYRMAQRGNNAQMPPVASKVVDPEGLAIIQAWIEGLQ